MAHSPYSRFGIGTLEIPGGIAQRGLGGITSPLADPFAINFANPASYSSMLRTVFQVGASGKMLTIKSADKQSKVNSSQVSELGLVFKKQGSPWAFAMGVAPYSNSGYSLTAKDSIAEIGELVYKYDGDGGLNKALVGLSRSFLFKSAADSLDKAVIKERIHPRLSIGANLDYYFGSLTQTRRVVYDNVTYYHTKITASTNIYGLGAETGLHYITPLSVQYEENKIATSTLLLVGATWSLNPSLNTRFSELTESFYYINGIEWPSDTVLQLDNSAASVKLPQRISIGAGIVKNFKQKGSLLLAADYHTQDWRKFSGSTGEFAASEDLKQEIGRAHV